MKRTIFFIGTAILIIIGFMYYEYGYKKPQSNIWSFVPANALGVYKSSDILETIDQIEEVRIIPSQLKGEYFKVWLSTHNKDSTKLIETLSNSQVLVSLHAIKNDAIDLVYYLNTQPDNKGSVAQDYINSIVSARDGSMTSRTYQGKEIIEIEVEGNSLSYFIENGILVFTKTSFLIEDVIRTLSDPDRNSYEKNHRAAIEVGKLKNDQGDLYINTHQIDFLSKIFTKEGIDLDIASSTFLDVKISDELVSLSGFSYSSGTDYLSTAIDQYPVSIGIKSYIPNSSYSVLHTGIDKQISWLKAQNSQFNVLDTLKGWSAENTLKWLGSEITLISMDMGNSDGKLLLVETRDINESLKQLNKLNESVINQTQDSVFYEHFGGVLIKELTVREFPEILFGKLYHGFPVSYYAVIDDYVAITNSLAAMYELINAIDQENTWGRSLDKSQWLSQTLQEGNISYFFDYSQAKGNVSQLLNETWSESLQLNEVLLNGLGMGAIQFSNIDGKYYTNVVLEYDPKRTEPEVLNFHTEHTTYLNYPAMTKPFVVRSHTTPLTREVIVQDSLTNIYLISNKGSIIWQDSMGDAVVDKIHQIDYYNNKKLQYLFAAGNSIHVIDRNGDSVENFPLDIKIEIDQLAVFDYDQTKNYRILVGDKKGDMHMYDKEGNNLEGWNPGKISSTMISPPRHIRVRGKDVIITVHSNDEIIALNRRGELYDGFPFKVENGISGDVNLSIGRDFKSTGISVISKEGELIQIDLTGTVQKKKQYSKPTQDTFFQLVNGVTKSSFVIVRQNAFRLSIVDIDEKIILEKDYLTNQERGIQYYDLGGSANIYVISDYTQGFGYIYDHTGKLMNNVPINNQYEIGLLRNTSKKKTLIYTTYEDQMTVYSY